MQTDLTTYTYIEDDIQVDHLIDQLADESILGIDTEASSLDPHTAVFLLLQISTEDEEVFVLNVGKVSRECMVRLMKFLATKECIMHNAKYDFKILYHHTGVKLTKLFDTQMAEILTKPGIATIYSKLSGLIKKYAGHTVNKETRDGFIGKVDHTFSKDLLDYAADDVRFLHRVRLEQIRRMEKSEQMTVWAMEQKLIVPVAMMEYTGVSFDVDAWRELSNKAYNLSKKASKAFYTYFYNQLPKILGDVDNAYQAFKLFDVPVKTKWFTKELEAITVTSEIYDRLLSDLNLNSYKQMLKVIQCFVPEIESTSKDILKDYKYECEFIDLLLRYREQEKRYSVYGEAFIEKHLNLTTGKIHTNFNQMGARTGRFASSKPNLQNIPAAAEYRACFIGGEGYHLARADYSQIELRILADLSGDPHYVEAYTHDGDLHTSTAAAIFEVDDETASQDKYRNVGKGVNFAVVYGTSKYGLKRNFGISLDEAALYLERYFRKYFILKQFIDLLGIAVVKRGYSVTRLGRRRYFMVPRVLKRSDYKAINKIKRQGVNLVVQGTSADMIKLAIIGLYYDNPFGYDKLRTVLTIHDEVVVEYSLDIEEEAKEFIESEMLKAGKAFLTNIEPETDVKTAKYWRK